MDFTLVLYVKHNVGLSALYSAPRALYSALSPTLCLTYRSREKSIVGCGLFGLSSETIILSRQLETKVIDSRHSILLADFTLNITSCIVRCITHLMSYT